MADIKQAALWLKEGKKVKRNAWTDPLEIAEIAYGDEDSVIRAGAGRHVHVVPFRPSDLLADDWEIVE